METESSAKSYYRYKLSSAMHCFDETLTRRLNKINQNFSGRILFDWTDFKTQINPEEIRKISSFYGGQFQLAHLLTTEQVVKAKRTFFGDDQNLNHSEIHIAVRNAEQLEAIDPILVEINPSNKINIHFSPRTKIDLISLNSSEIRLQFKDYNQYFWHFFSYNKDIRKSLTTFDVGHFFKRFPEPSVLKYFKHGKIKNLEIWNDQIPDHFELEPEKGRTRMWEFSTGRKKIHLSVIIPSFNNCKFLANVLRHLINQDANCEDFEIIVVEDGGQDGSSDNLRLILDSFQNKMNLKFIYWTKSHPERGQQDFFRAGQARNLGVRHSIGEKIVFLDSDILVPKCFVSTCLQELKNSDVIQFQRFHIHQELSHQNPSFDDVCLQKQVYVEESHYWNQLFNCHEWEKLDSYWKYTCTYALGIKKSDFLTIGRFKKYYVSYGFEDTDLGYEMHIRGKRFKLIKIPLLHLTSYDRMQYKNSSSKRTQLLKKTASKFYLQHLDPEIFSVLGNYFRFEKPFISFLKDLL